MDEGLRTKAATIMSKPLAASTSAKRTGSVRWWLRRPCLVGMSDAHLLATLRLLQREARKRGLITRATEPRPLMDDYIQRCNSWDRL
jgi:hypothetical protein